VPKLGAYECTAPADVLIKLYEIKNVSDFYEFLSNNFQNYAISKHSEFVVISPRLCFSKGLRFCDASLKWLALFYVALHHILSQRNLMGLNRT